MSESSRIVAEREAAVVGAETIRFGRFELELTLPELKSEGVPVEIGATALRLLVCLVAARGDIVSNDALIEAVWSGVSVSDDSLYTALREARRAVGDDGRQQHVIQTRKGRGYRFIAAVEVEESGSVTAEEIAEQLRLTLDEPPPAPLVDCVYERTDGVPALVGELIARLSAEGISAVDAVLTAQFVPLSAALLEKHIRKLARLPDTALGTLQAAAVLGPELLLEALLALQPDATRVQSDLRRATELGWIELVPGRGQRLRFRSAAAREWLHDGIVLAQREAWHHSAAQFLIADGDLHDPDVASRIASHLLQAGSNVERHEQIEWGRRAASASERAGEFESALAHYRGALSLSESQPWELRFDLLSAIGSLFFRLGGDPARARAAYREAGALARQRGDVARLSAAALGFSGAIANTETASFSMERVALLEEALGYAPQLDGGTIALLKARLAIDLRWTERVSEVPDLLEDAVSRARNAASADTLVSVLHDAYWASWSPDNLDERLALAQEMSEAVRYSSDGAHPLFVSSVHSSCLLESGDRAAAELALGRGAELTLPGGHTGLSYVRLGCEARFALLDGRFAEAESLIRRAHQVGSALRLPNADTIFAAQLGWLRFDQERLHELDAVSLVPQRSAVPMTRAGTALILAHAGRTTEARAVLEQMVDHIDEVQRDPFWTATVTTLIELAALLCAGDEARRLGGLLEPYMDRSVLLGVRTVCRGSVAFFVGLAALADDRPADAVRPLETAVDANARLRATPLLARTQIKWAQASVQSGRNSDDVRNALAEALHTREVLGLSIEDPEIEAILG